MNTAVSLIILAVSFFLFSCSHQTPQGEGEAPYQSVVVFPMTETPQSIEQISQSPQASTGEMLPPVDPAIVGAIPPENTEYPALGINQSKDPNCLQATIVENDVRGSSMVPLFVGGDVVQYSSGYYRCFPVERWDIIIAHIGDGLIIKRTVGIPGDAWRYESGAIIINGKPATNSEGVAYNIQSSMLTLYSQSYPTIPPDTYLILGNHVDGTLDASRFGLVARQDIIGKVILKNGKPLEKR
jgi:signal peptidase I